MLFNNNKNKNNLRKRSTLSLSSADSSPTRTTTIEIGDNNDSSYLQDEEKDKKKKTQQQRQQQQRKKKKKKYFTNHNNVNYNNQSNNNTIMASSNTSTIGTVLAKITTLLCLCWICIFLIYGSTSIGQKQLESITKLFSNDTKGGNPFIHISLPIMIASTLSIIFVSTLPQSTSPIKFWCSYKIRNNTNYLCRKLLTSFGSSGGGDPNYTMILIVWFVIPISFYTILKLSSKVSWDTPPSKTDDFEGYQKFMYGQLKNAANTIGLASIILLPLTLIPVSRHSLLIKIFNYSLVQVTFLHIWLSRLCVLLGITHGCLYMYQWYGIGGESLWYMLFPSNQCWYENTNPDDFNCVTSKSNCNCYNLKRNFTGFMALLMFVVLTISSLGIIRRLSYQWFYVLHIINAPLSIIFIIIHWNRSILYLAGGIIYYLASSLPFFLESYLQNQQVQNKIKPIISFYTKPKKSKSNVSSALSSILSVPSVRIVHVDEIIPGGNEGSSTTESSSSSSSMKGGTIIGITIEASEETLRQYQPGQYVNLSAPTISSIGHPFTINTTVVLESSQQQQQVSEGEKEFLVLDAEDNNTTAVSTTTTNGGDDDDDTSSQQHSLKRMRILFRVYGSFTRKLASAVLAGTTSKEEISINNGKSLSSYKDNDNVDDYYGNDDDDDDDNTKPPLPPIFLDGFYGVTDRVTQVLQHDKFVMVAGGIGITPYLSLLHELVLHAISSSEDVEEKNMFEDEESDDDDDDEYDAATRKKNHHRNIELHWICRDSHLIEYISKEYFEPIREIASVKGNGKSTKANISIMIHQTSSSSSSDGISMNMSNGGDETSKKSGIIKRIVPDGAAKTSSGTSTTAPFVLSNFATMAGGTSNGTSSVSSSFSSNLPMLILFTTSSVAGMSIFWYCYIEIQDKHAIFSRFVGIGVVTALIGAMTIILYCCRRRQSSSVNNNMAGSLFGCCFNWWSSRKARQPVDYTQVEVDDVVSRINAASTDNFHDEYGDGKTGLEMTTMMNGRKGDDGLLVGQRQQPKDTNTADSSNQRSFVQIDIKKYHHDNGGRPNLNALIEESFFSGDDNSCSKPGMLLCGPTSLINEITDLVNKKQKSCFRWFSKSSSSNQQHPISMYTDSFEM